MWKNELLCKEILSYEILKNEESIFVVDNLQKEYYVYHIKS